MPERNPTATPTIIAGTVLTSGDANTGQMPWTAGGSRTFTKQSGTAGGAAVAFTGAGRLDSIQLHPSLVPALSGQVITVFDAAAAASGHDGSGSKILFKAGAAAFLNGIAGAISLASGTTFPGAGPIPIGYAFTSGLSFSSQSGQTGFTLSYTPVVSG